MLQLICDIICMFLMVLGVVEIVRFFILKFMVVKKDIDELIVLPMYGHNEEAEFLLRSAATKLKWSDLNINRLIVCLDCGMDEETRNVCDNVSSEYDFMRVYNMDEFEKMLK